MCWRCQCGSHQCGKIAYFQIRATSSIFHPLTSFSPPAHHLSHAVYGKTLHIHGPLVFENLSPGLFHPLRTETSDWLTSKPDTNPPGWGGVTSCHYLCIHTFGQRTHRGLTCLPPRTTLVGNTPTPLCFAWVKSIRTLRLTCLPPQLARETERVKKV